MLKLEIHHSAVSNKIIDKASSMDIKIIKWKVVEDKDIPMYQSTPQITWELQKKKKVLLRNIAGCHINQVIKYSKTDRTTWNYIRCNRLMIYELHITYDISLSKIFNLNLI